MIIVELLGGLGNQMFQYAFGYSISTQLGIPVKFDVQALLDRKPKENFTFRDFELDIFEGKVALATAADTLLYRPLLDGRSSKLPYRILYRFKSEQLYKEVQHSVYDSGVLDVGPNTYFQGYWQSEKYFKPCCETLIRRAFVFKPPLVGLNKTLADKMVSTCSVAMHVRRGDYVTDPLANKIHGTCSPAYYQEAVELIEQRVGGIELFVFSDEPEWVKQNMNFSVPTTFINHNKGKDSFEDMRLMSLCQHNIIANSSFSWWGAWLNSHANKIIVAPQRWNQIGSMGMSDLVPPEWIRI